MQIETNISGVLPRPQDLIAKTRLLDRGKLTEEEIEPAYIEATKTVILAQQNANLTQINSGMLKRQDLLRPFSSGIKGCEVGPMARWFNNNTFFKTPLVKDELVWKKSVTLDESYIDLLPDTCWKAVLPAPYTLAVLSHNTYYNDLNEVMLAYAEILNQESLELEAHGFNYFQYSDPALVYDTTKPKNVGYIVDALDILTNGLKTTTCLHTFFGDGTSIINNADDLAVDDIGIDLYETNLKNTEMEHNKNLVLGIIDARNSVIENVDNLTAIVKRIHNINKPLSMTISTNCDMDFLTWDRAEEKMQVLTQVAEKLRGK